MSSTISTARTRPPRSPYRGPDAGQREKPNDADMAFLLGVYLHFDRQPDLAAKSFDRAARLVGNHSRHIELFMNRQNGLLAGNKAADVPPPPTGSRRELACLHFVVAN